MTPIKLSFIALALLTLRTAAFLSSPPSRTTFAHHHCVNCSTLKATLEDAADPFDSYRAGSDQLAIKEVSPGQGEGAADGDVLTVSFQGNVWSSGYQFEKADNFIFKMGGGRCMPGLNEGLKGAKQGSKRILRIPPSLGFGATGAGAGRIPPNSDLEMEVEVLKITRGDLAGQLALFGEGRFLGMLFFLALMAGGPFLEKAFTGGP